MTTEFAIIEKFFTQQTMQRSDVCLSIGDDAAIVAVPPQQQLLLSVDTLLAGVHFPAQTSPYDIAYKALAVNLSDLAAMAAAPAWFTLALTLAEVDEGWLAEFSRGLWDIAEHFAVQLVGGDTTRGSLSISITALGFAPPQQALTRSAAKVGDWIYVTGSLGGAGLALEQLQNAGEIASDDLAACLHRPWPRVREGLQLRNIAHAAIDISDGLAADLGHILASSSVGATIETVKLPMAEALLSLPIGQALSLALTAGDDYELCFTVPPDKLDALAATGIRCHCIGRIEVELGLRLGDAEGNIELLASKGYQHFG